MTTPFYHSDYFVFSMGNWNQAYDTSLTILIMDLWKALGFLALALGTIGIFVPILPTTPFVLLAAACFARSSPYMHAWLLQNKLFGPIINNWESNHCIPKKTKIWACLSTLGVGLSSAIFFVPSGYLQLIAIAGVAIGISVILRLPACPPPTTTS